MKIKFVVFDQSWRLEKSGEFEEEWTGHLPHCGDLISLQEVDEIATVKRRIWQTNGDLTLHVVREEKPTEGEQA